MISEKYKCIDEKFYRNGDQFIKFTSKCRESVICDLWWGKLSDFKGYSLGIYNEINLDNRFPDIMLAIRRIPRYVRTESKFLSW